MTKIFDVSLTIHAGMTVWPGEMKVEVKEDCLIEKGDVCNVSHFVMGMHCGTHIDVPLHFINKGMDTENIELEKFMGRAKVIEIIEDEEVGLKHLEGLTIDEKDMILLKVKKNSGLLKQKSFREDYVALSEKAAEFLAGKRIKAVGINYFSIEKFDAPEQHPVHKVLLQNGIVIIEGLNLIDIEPGEYHMICLPLKFRDGNGSPVRAVLIKE